MLVFVGEPGYTLTASIGANLIWFCGGGGVLSLSIYKTCEFIRRPANWEKLERSSHRKMVGGY
jgi:hypothetical protein